MPAPNSAYPESVTRLIDELAKLPGIGRRSAERLAFYLLKAPKPDALALARAITDVKQRVRHCRVCYNLADGHADSAETSIAPAASPGASTSAGHTLCSICADPRRDRSLVMVVEQPKDLISLEQTGAFRGLYHVLMGRIALLEGVRPGDLTVSDLMHRIEQPASNAGSTPVREVILALNPTMESDGTGLYLAEQITQRGVKITRLARGLPTGSQLEFASKAVLADAIQERRSL